MKAREGRKHYKKLSKNLGTRPANTAAHHVVSWYDKEATEARQILRHFGIDVDSSQNGVYLPRFKKHTPHPKMPDAHPHSSIHTKKYYINITNLLREIANVPRATKEDIEDILVSIGSELQDGSFVLDKIIESEGV